MQRKKLENALATKKRNLEASLTVVKKIVELYGGRIWVASEFGAGTTFSFTLAREKVKLGQNELQADLAR